MKSEIKKSARKPTSTSKATKTKQKEETYRLTPKGIFTTCLMDIFNLDFSDRRIDLAWELFDTRMHRHGYVED